MENLERVIQEIIYSEILFLVIMILTFLYLKKLINANHKQSTSVEVLTTFGTIFVLFGIPYIMIQSTFYIGIYIVAVVSIVLTGLLFLQSIEFVAQ